MTVSSFCKLHILQQCVILLLLYKFCLTKSLITAATVVFQNVRIWKHDDEIKNAMRKIRHL